jgi:hypothetical protein
MKKILFCVFISLLSCSCATQKKDDTIKTVFFDKFSNVSPAEILQQSFMKLETTDNCLLGFFDQIASTKNLLLILDDDKVFVFDTKGSYITQINCKGQGPGEYVDIASFFINEKDNVICLIDDSSQKVLFFSLDNFKFISEIKIPFQASCASFLPDGNIIWNNQEYLPKGIRVKDYFVKTDMSLNIISSYIKKQFMSGYVTGATITIYNVEGNIFAYMPFSPVIYQVSQNDVSPAFQLSIYERQFPPTEFLQDKSVNNTSYFDDLIESDYVSHFNVEENAADLCLFYIAKKQRFVGIYDKINQITYHYIFDDFQKNLQIGNTFTYLAPGKIDDYYVIPLHPSELKMKKENGYIFSESLNSLIDKSQESDNPILFLFKLSKQKEI